MSKRTEKTANKHKKRCSTSYDFRESQNTLAVRHMRYVRYHHLPIRMAKIQNTDNSKYWQGSGATGTLIHCWWECKMVRPVWKTIWQFLKKLNILLLYDPGIMFLGIYAKELKTHQYRNQHVDVYSNIIHNHSNLEASVHQEVYGHNGILLSHKEERICVSSKEVDEPRTYYRVK